MVWLVIALLLVGYFVSLILNPWVTLLEVPREAQAAQGWVYGHLA